MPKKVELLIVEPVFENKPKHKNIYLMCTSDDRLISVQGPFENPLYHLMRDVGKRPLCQTRTAKIKIRVRINAICSGYSVFVDEYYNDHWFWKRATKALISLRKCAGWSGPALSAKCIRALLVLCASTVFHGSESSLIAHVRRYVFSHYCLVMFSEIWSNFWNASTIRTLVIIVY